MRGIVGAAACLALAAAAGCAGRHTPVPVRGVVTLGGKPVEGATVTFYLEGGDAEGRPATGQTDADGAFRLSTMGDNDGALPGTYRVVIAKFVPGLPNLKVPDFPNTPDGQMEKDNFLARAYANTPRFVTALPGPYGDAAKTPLRCEVPPKQQPVRFDLTSP
jgi:hypothetical protein